MTKHNSEQLQDYRRQYQDNLETIRTINRYLIAMLISIVLFVIGVAAFEIEFFGYVCIIGMIGTILFSCLCASAAGYSMDPFGFTGFDGAGCITFLLLPLYFIILPLFSCIGWFLGLREKNRRIAENNRLYAEFGDNLL